MGAAAFKIDPEAAAGPAPADAPETGKVRQFLRVVQPTGEERALDARELIVSKTDPKGVITYCNTVFSRLAAMSEDEALGAPHSIIRHPDMPRCVFQLLWETIAEGREIFAYVNNLARDGANYWVFAHVTPTFGPDGRIVGHHSNRRKPERSAVEACIPLYAELKAMEDSHSRKTEGSARALAHLRSTLDARGVSYDEFVFTL
jgi:PAS domain S-box-containing protein